MSFLPEWAPNLHPAIVHFPIAILFLAVLVDVVGLVLRGKPFWRQAAVVLYVAGGLGALATWLTGENAADTVFLPTEANALLTEHADLGEWTFWFFGGYAILRVILLLTGLTKKTVVHVIMVVVAAGGLVLLYSTAEHGAQLVYRYGVGIQAVDHSPETIETPTDSTTLATAAPVSGENGGWSWKPTRAAAWRASMLFLSGDAETVRSVMTDGGDHGDVLGLNVDRSSIMFIYDQPFTDLQLDLAVDLDQFDGVLMFVHHVGDADNYRFTAIGNGEMRQGRSENGDLYLLDTKPFIPSGWQTYRVVSDGTHTRTYAGETLITHGHGTVPDAGPVGLRINGSGTVLLDFMKAQPLIHE